MINQIYSATIDGKAGDVSRLTAQALEDGIAPKTILDEALTLAMEEIGRRFECGKIFVPEMLVAARAMKESMAVLKPHFVRDNVQPRGQIVIGTVQGDLHDIGKNLVAMMLEGAGFKVIDLGVNVAAKAFVKAATEGVQIIAMSALLTTTMVNMQAVIHALEEAGLRDRVKVMVGGAPVNEEFAKRIGADGYASDAGSAARVARALINKAESKQSL